MKKLFIIFFVLLFNTAGYSLVKPSLYILDKECVVFVKGSNENANSNTLNYIINTLNHDSMQFWYIKKDDYSKIIFNNKLRLPLNYFYNNKNRLILYKKNSSHYILSLYDENLYNKINEYFGRQIFPNFEKRTEKIKEESGNIVMYINHSDQEVHEMKVNYLDNNEYQAMENYSKTRKAKLKSELEKRNIDYKEIDKNVREITFGDDYKINLKNKGGSVIVYKHGKLPEFFSLSDLNKIALYFK